MRASYKKAQLDKLEATFLLVKSNFREILNSLRNMANYMVAAGGWDDVIQAQGLTEDAIDDIFACGERRPLLLEHLKNGKPETALTTNKLYHTCMLKAYGFKGPHWLKMGQFSGIASWVFGWKLINWYVQSKCNPKKPWITDAELRAIWPDYSNMSIQPEEPNWNAQHEKEKTEFLRDLEFMTDEEVHGRIVAKRAKIQSFQYKRTTKRRAEVEQKQLCHVQRLQPMVRAAIAQSPQLFQQQGRDCLTMLFGAPWENSPSNFNWLLNYDVPADQARHFVQLLARLSDLGHANIERRFLGLAKLGNQTFEPIQVGDTLFHIFTRLHTPKSGFAKTLDKQLYHQRKYPF